VGGSRDRPRGELCQPRFARRGGCRLLDPARAGYGLCLHGVFRHQPAAHFARCPDHCARSAGRRRDDHDRNDGQSARAGRRARACSNACLGHDGISDADRHPRYGRRFCTYRLRKERRRRILLFIVRGHRCGALGLVDRRSFVRAGDRGHDPAKDDEIAWWRTWSACAPAG